VFTHNLFFLSYISQLLCDEKYRAHYKPLFFGNPVKNTFRAALFWKIVSLPKKYSPQGLCLSTLPKESTAEMQKDGAPEGAVLC
jgi:hypothetical protein